MMAKKEPCSILVKEIHNISEKYFNNKINDSGLTMSQARALSILLKCLEKRLTLKQLEKELDLAQSVMLELLDVWKESNILKALKIHTSCI